MKPQIGDKVYINHRSKMTKSGIVKVEPTTTREARVTAVYSDGAVLCNTGDVWCVHQFRDGWSTHTKQSRV